MGNSDTVYILLIREKYHEEVFRVDRQKKYYSKEEKQDKLVNQKHPALAWGYGHSPANRDQRYSILAIGWGPVV